MLRFPCQTWCHSDRKSRHQFFFYPVITKPTEIHKFWCIQTGNYCWARSPTLCHNELNHSLCCNYRPNHRGLWLRSKLAWLITQLLWAPRWTNSHQTINLTSRLDAGWDRWGIVEGVLANEGRACCKNLLYRFGAEIKWPILFRQHFQFHIFLRRRFVFWSKAHAHRSLFLGVQLANGQCWLRQYTAVEQATSQFPNQWWPC